MFHEGEARREATSPSQARPGLTRRSLWSDGKRDETRGTDWAGARRARKMGVRPALLAWQGPSHHAHQGEDAPAAPIIQIWVVSCQ